VPLEGDRLVLGEVEKRDFVVGAGQQDVAVELVDVDDVRVLVRVELVGVLIGLVALVVAILQDQAVGVPTKESVLECLHLVQYGWLVADTQSLRVTNFCRLRDCDAGLLFVHYI
jgi:hypothetical protein